MRGILHLAIIIVAAYMMWSLNSGAQSIQPAEFVNKISAANEFNIVSSKVALEKSSSENVRKHAQMMVDDYTSLGIELKSILPKTTVNITAITQKLESDDEEDIVKLRSLNDTAFDKEYKDDIIDAHEDMIELFEEYTKEGEEAELRSFATKTLPKLRAHKLSAEAL
jgi:putative membrane protein